MKRLSCTALGAGYGKVHAESRGQRKGHMSMDMCMHIIMLFFAAAFMGVSVSFFYPVVGHLITGDIPCQAWDSIFIRSGIVASKSTPYQGLSGF